MDEIDILAHALGFGRAMALFPDDVREAARRADLQRNDLEPPDDPSCEPYPAMHAPHPRAET